MFQQGHVFTSLAFALSICVAGLLVASFAMHALQIDHNHVSISDDGHAHSHAVFVAAGDEKTQDTSVSLGEYMHAHDKKSLLLFVAVLVLVFYTTSSRNVIFTHIVLWQYKLSRLRKLSTRNSSPQVHYLQALFAVGILHPKLF